MSVDPLKALFYPFDCGATEPPHESARILFVNARLCGEICSWPRNSVIMQQYFKPWSDELARAGFKTAPDIPDGPFDAALVLASQQHEESRLAMAEALVRLSSGGLFVCAGANDAGGKRLKKDSLWLGIASAEESKYKSRVIWGRKEDIDRKRITEAIDAGSWRKVCGGRYISRPGVFSWNEIDRGSALLAESLPDGSLSGRGADFGCGFGYLSLQALARNPAISEIHCIDADARAVESCRRNIEAASKTARFIWEDITRGNRNLPNNLDWIVMNPPFHEGKRVVPETGAAFIRTARESLRPGGSLWMVANAHLPYEKTITEHFRTVRKIVERNGYKVFHAA